jgi:putative cell wall-binding protein
LVAALATAGIAASTFAITTPAGAAQVVTESRVAGADRYATAAAVALATFPGGSNNIILASGENFPDGLAASGLAGFANAPVVLTRTDSLPTATAGAIATLDGLVAGAATVHIIGGDAAVSPAVRAQLTALGYTLNELEGADRYETSAVVAEFAEDTFGSIGQLAGKRTAIIATGAGFADALAAGAPAFAGKHPILLTQPGALPQSVSDALTALSAEQVVIMGGTTAVSTAVETAITAKGISVIRIGGANRYETAKLLADTLINPGLDFNFYGAAPQEIVLVSGENFADALAAGPHAGAIRAPMLLVQQCNIPAPTAAFHVENAPVIDLVRAIGGTAAICEDVLDGAVAAATTVTPTATLAGDQGRTTFTVEFSEAILSSSVAPADFAVASPSRTVTPIGVAVVPPAATTSTQFVVTVDAELRAGDQLILAANSVQTPGLAPRFNALASASVAADTTRPTATIIANAGGAEFYVIYSEPMNETSVELITSYTAPSVVLSANVLPGTNGTTVLVSLTNPLTVGQSVGVVGALPSTGALDLAGNPVIPTSRSVVNDTVKPFMQSATLTNTNTAQRVVQNTYVQFTAVAGSATAGAAGNAFAFDFVDVDGLAAPTFTSGSVAGVPTITIRGDFVAVNGTTSLSPNISTATLTAAWNASPLTSLFTINAVGGPLVTEDDIAPFTGTPGATTSTLVIQFNEAVQDVDLGDFEVYTSNTVGASLVPFSAAAPATGTAIDGKVTLTEAGITNPLLVPVAGTAIVRTPTAGDIADFANPANFNNVQNVTITAG